jgi:hypothetical protein
VSHQMSSAVVLVAFVAEAVVEAARHGAVVRSGRVRAGLPSVGHA